jgi:hypothetical protein
LTFTKNRNTLKLPRVGLYLIKFSLPMSSMPRNCASRAAFRLVVLLIFSLAVLIPAGISRAAYPAQELTPTETGTPTLTATASETVDLTPTVSETATITETLFAAPSGTVTPPTPPTLTPSPGFTPTPTDTLTPTPTTTLEPLPELTLLFPVFTPTATSTRTPEPTERAATQAAEARAAREPIPRDVQWVGFLVILLWLLLGGFLVAFIRYFTR